MSDLIAAFEAVVRASPESVPLRLHFATLLMEDEQPQRAIAEIGSVLASDPSNVEALTLLGRVLSSVPGARLLGNSTVPEVPDTAAEEATASPNMVPAPSPSPPESPTSDSSPSGTAGSSVPTSAIDWGRLEAEIGVDIPPPFVANSAGSGELEYVTVRASDSGSLIVGEPVTEMVTLADVGGLEPVKERLRIAFLEPMRNPEIAKAYGKTLRGGMLLYGPPGTGKTFLARAVAGELGARFMSISIADVLDGVMGESEKNVQRIFDRARALAPCVLFIDELDALGGKRSSYSNIGWMRNVVNQLLHEMDGVDENNDGVFILAATNYPWDVDGALLRPGRLDRIVLVTAPDAPARAAILQHSLTGRPIAGIDLDELVTRTHGFSGADLTHVVSTAAERAMDASLRGGRLLPIGMQDLRAALDEIKPSIGPWLQSARNVVDFANLDGRYDDLKLYLQAEMKRKKRRR